MYAETVAGRPSRYPGCGTDLADGYDAVLAYFDRLDTEARNIIGGLSDADLQRKCTTPAGKPDHDLEVCSGQWWNTRSITAVRST
jgi:hypothetical protein